MTRNLEVRMIRIVSNVSEVGAGAETSQGAQVLQLVRGNGQAAVGREAGCINLRAWADARRVRPAVPQSRGCLAIDGRPVLGRPASESVVNNLKRSVQNLRAQLSNAKDGRQEDARQMNALREKVAALEAKVRALEGVSNVEEPAAARVIPLRPRMVRSPEPLPAA